MTKTVRLRSPMSNQKYRHAMYSKTILEEAGLILQSRSMTSTLLITFQ